MSRSNGQKDTSRKFAEITCLLEDLHGIAVEGQAASQSDCFYNVLIMALENGCRKMAKSIASIQSHLE